MINLNNYVDIVMEKLKSNGYYSELDIDELERVIFKQLTRAYDKKVAYICIQLDMDRINEKVVDHALYKEEYDKIKREMILLAHEISLTSKPLYPAIIK